MFGDTGPFFFSQEFALGGVQYGEQLRGYEEFSITPHGYITGHRQLQRAQRSRSARRSSRDRSELGFRVNQ